VNDLFSQPYLTPISWDNKAAAVGGLLTNAHGKKTAREKSIKMTAFWAWKQNLLAINSAGEARKTPILRVLVVFQSISPLEPSLRALISLTDRSPSASLTELNATASIPPGDRRATGTSHGSATGAWGSRVETAPCPARRRGRCPFPRAAARAELPADAVPMGARWRWAPAPRNLLDAAATAAQKD